MAGFRTHITVSSALGVGYGAVGYFYFGLPPGPCLLATGLCSVSGMLPDLDSDSGVPLRESLAFAASVMPMLMMPRFKAFGLSPESMVLAGAAVYLLVRFGLGALLKNYTVHRGMFHSVPAAVIATEVAFLVYCREEIEMRYFVSLAVTLGFMSHLVLDEIWSVTVKRGQLALKKSSGTAVKFWGDSRWANLSCYGKLLVLSYFVLHDPVWMYDGTPPSENLKLIAQRFMSRVRGEAVQDGESLFDIFRGGRKRANDDDDMPPLREVPKSRVTERSIRIEEGPSPDQRRNRYGRSDPFWEERRSDRFQDQDDVVSPNPRYRNDEYRPPRYDDDRPIYQR